MLFFHVQLFIAIHFRCIYYTKYPLKFLQKFTVATPFSINTYDHKKYIYVSIFIPFSFNNQICNWNS